MERWEIARIEYGTRPEGEGWQPFAVEGGLVYWRRPSGQSVQRPESAAPEPPRRTDQAEHLSSAQVARLCGVHVSTVRRWVRRRELPEPARIGGVLRWRRADVEARLAGGQAPETAAPPWAARKGRRR